MSDEVNMAGLPSDVQDMINLREYVDDLRVRKNYVVDKLPEPPVHVPGCDDPKGKFDWYIMIDETGKTLGYFHVRKGVML